MATITVTTAADVVAADGLRSLREAVSLANATPAADTIVFAPSLEGRTLTLTQGELVLTQDVTIDGDRNNDGREVTLSGGDLSRILHVTGEGTDATLRDLTLTQGRTTGEHEGGGAVLGEAGTSLNLDHATVRGNSTAGQYATGGAILGSTVLMSHSTISGNSTVGYDASGGGISVGDYGTLTLMDSSVSDNATVGAYASGGGIRLGDHGSLTAINSTIGGNNTAGLNAAGGGISGSYADSLTLADSTVYGNRSIYSHGGGIESAGTVVLTSTTVSGNSAGIYGGGIYGRALTLLSSTVSGNHATDFLGTGDGSGGGIFLGFGGATMSNSIVAGNSTDGQEDDFVGAIASSNGHNIFGSDVVGAFDGDLQGVAASRLFAGLDPDTGGGSLNAAGIIPLRNNVTNPALGGGDSLAVFSTDQIGTARPLPFGSLPDIGASERNQTLSTHESRNNDVLSGTAAVDNMHGNVGSDLISGLAGNDTLRGEAGNDLLDGGSGNDLLDGGDGIDLARFGGSIAVTINLVAGTATRGSETDTLTSIQGAIGSNSADIFQGDGGTNLFQGGTGRDIATGGAGRDLYDYDRTSDSLPGPANHDVITDFVHNSDKIDLTGIDGNVSVPGNQAFVWLGNDALTGAGQVNFFSAGGNTIVQASTDADASPELQIQLTGSVTLSASDFYL